MNFTIRRWSDADDLESITEMLHRAYAPLAARGLRFTATYQTSEVTLRRLVTGHSLVAECEGLIVGTITVYRSSENSDLALYRDATACHFGQFGVDPEFQGHGIGRALHLAVLEHAATLGVKWTALDTAAPAADLVALYERWGYAIVERKSWAKTNYESVIMTRKLD